MNFALVQGMAPVFGEAPTTLILGSMPGVASLDAQHYYAHPRNLFWPLMAEIFQFPLHSEFALRYAELKKHQVALWDVLAQCERKGSLDSAIKPATARCNPILDFVLEQGITKVCVNGKTAYTLLNKHFPSLKYHASIHLLPSTSPAHASLTRDLKVREWHQALAAEN